jgi:hypothetical protein
MWLIIGAAVLGSLVLLLVLVPALVHYFIGPALQDRVSKVYPPDQVAFQDLQAMTYGLESKGVTQARGNGALVLTARELHFFQYIPETGVRMPLDAITGVKIVRSHLGKASGRDLLHVSFTVGGKADSMAWTVTDVGAWVARLGDATRKAGTIR